MVLNCLHRTYSKFIVGSPPGKFQWCGAAAFLTFDLQVNEENLKHDRSSMVGRSINYGFGWNSNQMTRRGQQCSTFKLTQTLQFSGMLNITQQPPHSSYWNCIHSVTVLGFFLLFFFSQVKLSHVNLLTADCPKLFSCNIFSTSSLDWFKTCGL